MEIRFIGQERTTINKMINYDNRRVEGCLQRPRRRLCGTYVVTIYIIAFFIFPSCNSLVPNLLVGSTCPSTQGKIRIYSMRFCPFAQRSILVLLAKGIPHDVVNVNLMDKPDWLLMRNPLGKVPVLECDDGRILCESLIVSDYLDETYPNRQLSSADPFQKALDRLWIERFKAVISYYHKVLYAHGDATAQQSLMKEFTESLQPFETELVRRGTKFFAGNELPGMLDYMIWPWTERAPVFKVLYPTLFDYENAKEKYPKLESWRQAMKEDSAVKEFYLSPEQHVQFVQSFIDGSPAYDLLEDGLAKL